MIVPASELLSAEQKHRCETYRNGLPIGLPAHIQHDMHRLTGWSEPLGVYIDNQMVRSIGIIDEPDTEDEKDNLRKRVDLFWEHHHSTKTKRFRSDLIARSAPADLTSAVFIAMEASVAKRKGIAAELYPYLFDLNTSYVDKDGLVDYAYLSANFKLVQPGVFMDKGRGLLLFAHCFWRRSLSHRNKLNSYFLQTFTTVAEKNSVLRSRLKLDADIIGHPDSARHLIELEYWHGPMYNDDIARIPQGVAEHKADESTRYYEGVSFTQFWWKAPESRKDSSDRTIYYRTFEAEELVEDPSAGLPNAEYGCRYTHAEFAAGDKNITHFDGAIRAYDGAKYLERIDRSIDRAGKHADYTKLFRFDGALEISQWKRLMSDFFRGNALIPEYFGGPTEAAADMVDSSKSPDEPALQPPELSALISMRQSNSRNVTQLIADRSQKIGDLTVPFVEIGTGEVAQFLQRCIDLSEVMAVGVRDDILNLSPIYIKKSDKTKQEFDEIMIKLSSALAIDADKGKVNQTSVALCWEDNGLTMTLSIAGNAKRVAMALRELPQRVDLTRSTASWVEPVAELFKKISSGSPSAVHWCGVERGLLRIARDGVVQQQMLVPGVLKEKLVAEGILSVDQASELDAFDDKSTRLT